jgi:hypothetical protein
MAVILDAPSIHSPGMVFKNKETEFSVSTEILEKLLDSFERVLRMLLDWASAHPYLFALTVFLLATWLVVRYWFKLRVEQMKIEYERERTRPISTKTSSDVDSNKRVTMENRDGSA